MSIRVALNHRTTYKYDRFVNISPHVVRLRPAPHCRTPILSYSLRVKPESQFLNWQQDPSGNYLARYVFLEPAKELSIEVDLIAEMTVINPFDFFLEADAIHYPFVYGDVLKQQLAPYLATEPMGPRFAAFVNELPRHTQRTVDFLVEVNSLAHRAVKYVIRMEPGVQTPEQTLEIGTGSCRDSAWLLVQAMRQMGLAARFVSGYLIQLQPDVKPLDGPAGAERDFTDLHAWAEVYLPGAGWVGMDPTSGLLAGEGHLPLAATPEPMSAAPISGSVDPCEVDFNFEMSVKRVHEDPRVTKPYTDEQWAKIESLGHEVDRLLEVNNVRLTMGGEPTFVSIDDMDGEEWNTAALGPHKRKLAGQLFCRLADRFADGPADALWARQMVSRRAIAAVGIGLLLADRRRAHLATTGIYRQGRRAIRVRRKSRTAIYFGAGRQAAGRIEQCDRGLRRRLVLPVERAAAAGECRSIRFEIGTARGPRAVGEGL